MSTKQRRVTLALKWHHLDNLNVEEIQQRFEDEGVGSYAASTIRGYLNEDPADDVLEMIEEEHANTRLQIAEREERMFQRAREAEGQATKDEPIKRVVPQTAYCKEKRGPFEMPAWEIVEPDDDGRPEWTEKRDVIIRFTEETRFIEPGDEYPQRSLDGSPKYTTEFVGLERDVDDLQNQSMARQEQSKHLQAKGEVLGVYSTDVNLTVDGEMENTITLDEDAAAAVREADLQEGADE